MRTRANGAKNDGLGTEPIRKHILIARVCHCKPVRGLIINFPGGCGYGGFGCVGTSWITTPSSVPACTDDLARWRHRQAEPRKARPRRWQGGEARTLKSYFESIGEC